MSSRASRRQRGLDPSAALDSGSGNVTPMDGVNWSSLKVSDAAWISIHPVILLLGFAFSILSPSVQPPVSATGSAPSYFAQKSNIFNLYFVKVGWAWTIFAFVLFVSCHPLASAVQKAAIPRRRVQALIRLALLTVWWTAVSQWFFGPALMERSFRLTGGACEFDALHQLDAVPEEPLVELTCKRLGGRWKGGHDISGHVFLLVLSSTALLLEAKPFLQQQGDRREDGPPPKEGNSPAGTESQSAHGWTLEISVLLAVVTMDLWMLFMTAIYFHTLLEKVSGLLAAYAGLIVVYLLPRLDQSVNSVIGLPGS